ncbi:MAG: hypothetical protein JMN24_15995 [gamma proteobacterium endosymbiont of Lamellibrachia anaximandri]|nr:hypothetical protein [gamma proteobacterium endosymbiont of Lamellibrachia anaximandri]MBL3619368.1 hypothetical protein [gamma proteobacterium endosymbiont of Lamellibrachia anaximandri]
MLQANSREICKEDLLQVKIAIDRLYEYLVQLPVLTPLEGEIETLEDFMTKLKGD